MALMSKEHATKRTVIFSLLAALATTSCADIFGFERGALREEDDDGGPTGGAGGGAADAKPGGSGGADASPDVNRGDTGRGDANADGAADRGGAAGSGGTGGGTGATGGSGGSGGGTGGSSGGTGGSSGGTGGSSGGSGGGPDASIDTGNRDGSGGGTLDVANDRGITCATDQKICNGVCVAKTDPATGCGQMDCSPCALDHATATCGATGQCAVGTCSTGFANCNNMATDGCEADLSKVETCGSCTTRCDATAPLCSGSNGTYQCVTGCTAPTSTLCGSQCVDVNTNASHCGACMMPCPTKTNGDSVCVSRMCDFTCHGGYHKCTATQTCASDTDINACGDTCKKCEVPANGRVSCTAGDCAVTCNTNYHQCGTTCVDDNSPATCGTTSCSPCPTPTDPNADPMPTCINKTCGFKCKTGFNLCGGACSDMNSVNTCGPSCTMCTRPANSSAVSCNGTSCVVTCNPGYEPSGMQCVLAQNIYVSTSGSDTNPGTQAAPFRTWKRAAQVAQSGVYVNFAPGNYNSAGGDDFGDVIPASVTLRRSGTGTVTFTADGVRTMSFAGNGGIEGITLTNFGAPLTATTGVQNIKGVTITQPHEPIRVSGNAFMVIAEGSSITGGPGVNRYLIGAESAAQLTVRDSTLTGAWEACVTPTVAGEAIRASGTTYVTIVGVTFAGIMNIDVKAMGSTRLSISDSNLMHTCGGGLQTHETASVVVNSGQFGGIGCYDNASLTVNGGSVDDTGLGVNLYNSCQGFFHNFTFGGSFGVNVAGTGSYDFGNNSNPGNNTFNPSARDQGGLNVNVDGVAVSAVGNRWVAGEQTADGAGRMPAGVTWGPVSGKNFSVQSNLSYIEF